MRPSPGHHRQWPAAACMSAVRTAPSIRSMRRADAFTGPTAPRAACARRLRWSCHGATGALVYFGDTAANAYALNAETGRVVWTRKVEDHPLARITGSPTLACRPSVCAGLLIRGIARRRSAVRVLHVPRQRQRARCGDGRVIWKTMMITDPLQRRGTSTAGRCVVGAVGIGDLVGADDRRRAQASLRRNG